MVVWRCHVGADHPTELVDTAWRFLLPYSEEADGFIFTRRAYVPPALDPERVGLLTPAIDRCPPEDAPRGRVRWLHP